MNFVQRLDNTIDLELARKILLGLSAGVLVLIPADGIWTHLRKFPGEQMHLSNAPVQTMGKSPETLAAYQTVFEKNTLFGTVSNNSQTPALKSSIEEMTKDYRLKGVVFLGEPEAILEDAKTQKTVFVKAGQAVGDLTVKEIKEGMMVFSYLGEEIKLEVQ